MGKWVAGVVTCAAVFIAAADVVQVPLNYNFNGIVHVGEAGMPDAPDGYRAISDRGLDFQGGIPAHAVLDNYQLVGEAGVFDIVHLGNRNTVDGGNWAFGTNNGPNIGMQPDWLPDPDQTGTQTTVLAAPITMNANSQAGIIFQISNGGGSFDVRFAFSSGADVVAQLIGPDWFGPFNGQPNIGQFFGTQDVDRANTGANLLLTEGIVDLGGEVGRELVSIGFENRTNTLAGYAIVAVNLEGGGTCEPCDMNCDGAINAFDIEPFLDLLFGPGKPCDLCTGDVNGDGVVDAFDIEPFLNCLFP
jgi:hypothetical protein